MLKTAVLAALCAVLFASNAEARQRHRVAHQLYSPECNVSMPCEGVGKPVVSLSETHTEVIGAAMLAGVSVGAYSCYEEAIERVVRTADRFEPDSRAHAAYDELFPIYKELYPSVEPYMGRLANLDLPQVWVTKLGDGR